MCLGCTVTSTPVTSLLRNSCKIDRFFVLDLIFCTTYWSLVAIYKMNRTHESCCSSVEIHRDKQLDYLMNGLRQLGPSFSSLDAKYVSSPCEKTMLCGCRYQTWLICCVRSWNLKLKSWFCSVSSLCSHWETLGVPLKFAQILVRYSHVQEFVCVFGCQWMNKLKFWFWISNSRPWVCYWIIHSIALLGESVDDDLENNAIDFLGRCQVRLLKFFLTKSWKRFCFFFFFFSFGT